VSEQEQDGALDGAFHARTWSALGPYGIGNRWSWAGRSGHGRLVRIAGSSATYRFDLGRRGSIGQGSNPSASIMRTAALGFANCTPSCPKQRFTAVSNGQQRSVAVASDLRHRLSLGGRTVLRKLAVSDAEVTSQATHNGRGHVRSERVQTTPATARIGGSVQGRLLCLDGSWPRPGSP
jgi:hypothetical protein